MNVVETLIEDVEDDCEKFHQPMNKRKSGMKIGK